MSRTTKPSDGRQNALSGPVLAPHPGGTGLLLRVLSITPFVLLGAVATIATVAWLLILVLGVGLERGAVWTWASGRPLSEIASQTGLLLLIGITCLAVVVASLYAAAVGFGSSQPRWFWPLAEIASYVFLGALVASRALVPDAVTQAGFTDRDWYVTFAVMVYAAIVMRLRRRTVDGRPRQGQREEADARS